MVMMSLWDKGRGGRKLLNLTIHLSRYKASDYWETKHELLQRNVFPLFSRKELINLTSLTSHLLEVHKGLPFLCIIRLQEFEAQPKRPKEVAFPSPQLSPGAEMSVEAHGGSATGWPNFVSQSRKVRSQEPRLNWRQGRDQLTESRWS